MSQQLNLFAPEFRADPYPHYARLRREAPVCHVEPSDFWLLTRHDDIQEAFKNPEVFTSTVLRMAAEPPWLGRKNPISEAMITTDPPRHGRLRSLVSRAFTASVLSQIESYARDVSVRLTEMLFQPEPVDFVPEFALGLPASVIALLMGVDPSLQKHFKRWADDITGAAVVAPDDVARQEEVRKSIGEMEKYLREVLNKRRSKPTDDLVSELVRSEVDGQQLSDEDMMAFLFLLLVGGLETTTMLLSHTAMILAQNPEWFDRLRNNEVLIAKFIEEVLRYEPPTHCAMRMTTRETTVGGVRLPAGAKVLLVLASGLRDEAHYPDPDQFNPERGIQANLAFGHGVHFCLGAPLARMEARVALDSILSMCSRFELATDKVQWNLNLFMRAPVSLPLRAIPL